MARVIKILVGNKLPSDFLKYDVVINTENMSVRHSRKVRINGKMVKFTNTRLYCHYCFKEFDNEKEWEEHAKNCNKKVAI